MSCLLIGATAVVLSGSGFTLGWTHSVERVEWREHWVIAPDGLRLTGAQVKGSGAGMEPGDGARLQDGWWRWESTLPPQPQLVLAASGATQSGWTLCDGADCTLLGGDAAEPVVLRPCPATG